MGQNQVCSLIRDFEFAFSCLEFCCPDLHIAVLSHYSGCNSNVAFSERCFSILWVRQPPLHHAQPHYLISTSPEHLAVFEIIWFSLLHVYYMCLSTRTEVSWGKYSVYYLHGYILSGWVSAWSLGSTVTICWLTHWPLLLLFFFSNKPLRRESFLCGSASLSLGRQKENIY